MKVDAWPGWSRLLHLHVGGMRLFLVVFTGAGGLMGLVSALVFNWSVRAQERLSSRTPADQPYTPDAQRQG